MALKFCCGAECRILTRGSAGSSEAHWGGTSAPCAIDTSVFRSGAASYRFDTNGSSSEFLHQATGWSGNTVVYARVYIRFTDVTPNAEWMILRLRATEEHKLVLSTGGVLQVGTGTTNRQSGPTLSADTWYGVEMQCDMRANPNTIDWRVWDATNGWQLQTQGSFAVAAQTTNNEIRIGICTTVAAGNGSMYMDDILIGWGTTIDEDWSDATPKGGEVKILRPNADGTHSFANSGDFKYENTTNFAQSATDVYTHLDAADMTQTTEYISQNVGTGGTLTKYCEVLFPNESSYTDPHMVMPVRVFRSSATQANEMNCRASDNGTNWTNLDGNWGTTGRDISDTSNSYFALLGWAPPSGGSWTKAKVDGLRYQFGMSDDISPVPFVCGLAFEVAWQEVTDSYAGLVAPTVVLTAVHRASSW